ncbi:MAG: carboxypeptidase-like regulatory domain-containing protein [Candidatus Diapherotrites archaeon]
MGEETSSGGNFIDSIRGVYFSFEEKWYAFLDVLDAKKIPVYKIIDPIDKVIPSFALFLGLSALIVLLIFALVLMLVFGGGKSSVLFYVHSDNVPLEGVELVLTQFPESAEGTEEAPEPIEQSTVTGEDGYAKADLLPLPVLIEISEGGYDKFREEFELVSDEGNVKEIEIELKKESTGPVRRKIELRDSSNSMKISKRAKFDFKCSGGEAPESATSTGGYEVKDIDSLCKDLQVKVSEVEGYNDSSFVSIPSATNVVRLVAESGNTPPDTVTPKGTLDVFVVDSLENPVSGVDISVKDNITGQLIDGGNTDSSGSESFELTALKTYLVEAYDDDTGFMGQDTAYILEGETAEVTFILASDLNADAKVFMKFVDGDSSSPVQGVQASLFSGGIEKLTRYSDAGGIIAIPLNFDSNALFVRASRTGYVLKIVDNVQRMNPDASTPQTIQLSPATASNSGTVAVTVYDSEYYGGGLLENSFVKVFNEFYPDVFVESGLTNSEGKINAYFLAPGTYYASAYYEESFGQSGHEDLDAGDTLDLNVQLDEDINGLLNIIVKGMDADLEKTPLADANVKVFDSKGNLIGNYKSDAEGKIVPLSLPGGRIYTLTALKPGYFSTTKETLELPYAGSLSETVLLFSEDMADEPTVFYGGYTGDIPAGGGLYRPNLTTIGKTYTANFYLFIPTGFTYSDLRAHFRADEDTCTDVDDCVLRIKPAGSTLSTPGLFYFFDEFDLDDLFRSNTYTGDSKVGNAKYTSGKGLVYSINTAFYLTPDARITQSYPIKFQTYWNTKDNSTELDEVEFSASNCSGCPAERFEFAFKWKNAAYTEPITLAKGSSGLLDINVTNLTKVNQTGLVLNITSRPQNALSIDSPGPITIGDLAYGASKKVSVTVNGLQEAEAVYIDFNLTGTTNPNKSASLRFRVLTDKKIIVSTDPAKIIESPGQAQDYTIKVFATERDTGNPVNQATVRIYKNGGNNLIRSFENLSFTNGMAYVTFSASLSSNNTPLKIVVENELGEGDANINILNEEYVGQLFCRRYTNESTPVYGLDEKPAMDDLNINWSYNWPALTEMRNRCQKNYCDGAQFLQLIAYELNELEGGSAGEPEQIEFDVFLKREGYSNDLINDFGPWGQLYGSYGAPPWFISTGGIKDYFNSNTMHFVDASARPLSLLSVPGKYHIKLRKSGSNVTISLDLRESPINSNPLLYLPFDEKMGSNDGTRTGYGVILNSNGATESGLKEFDNLAGIGGEGITDIWVNLIEDFEELNSPNVRSNLLTIGMETDKTFIAIVEISSPSVVTLDLKSAETDAGSLRYAEYEITKGTVLSANNSFTRWTGIDSSLPPVSGECVEFSTEKLPLFFQDRKYDFWNNYGFKTFSSTFPDKKYHLSFERLNPSNAFGAGEISLVGLFFVPNSIIGYPELYPCFKGPYSQGIEAGFKFYPPASKTECSQTGFKLKESFDYPVIALKDADNHDLISLIENGKACISLAPNGINIWWNEKQLIEDLTLDSDCLKDAKKYSDNQLPPWGNGWSAAPDTCDNGQVDTEEECDGEDLDGATCISEGFAGGELACTEFCQFDVSNCYSASGGFTCGDGVCEAGETLAGCRWDCDPAYNSTGSTCSFFDLVGCLAEPESASCTVCQGCGNGVCDSGETASNCAWDCLGNGYDETCAFKEVAGFYADCGGHCGNGTCDSGENATSCPWDCYGNQSGDTFCSLVEFITCEPWNNPSCTLFDGDCDSCGNGTCESDELEGKCAWDCLDATNSSDVCSLGELVSGTHDSTTGNECLNCGNGLCETGENTSCLLDCYGVGYDGVCSFAEVFNYWFDCRAGGVNCGNLVCETGEAIGCIWDCYGARSGDGKCSIAEALQGNHSDCYSEE